MKYTIGEIFRDKLLLSSDGVPYNHKASVSNVLKNYPYEVKQTPHGPAKMYDGKTIKAINKRWGL